MTSTLTFFFRGKGTYPLATACSPPPCRPWERPRNAIIRNVVWLIFAEGWWHGPFTGQCFFNFLLAVKYTFPKNGDLRSPSRGPDAFHLSCTLFLAFSQRRKVRLRNKLGTSNALSHRRAVHLREKMGVVMSFLEQSNFFSDLIRNATRGVGHLGHDVKELAKWT